MMKKPKILLSALLIFTMLFSYVASAAEVFQWIIEPSSAYQYAYAYKCYGNTPDFPEGYWFLGESRDDCRIFDSYGNAFSENEIPYVNGYHVETNANSQQEVYDASGNLLFISDYYINYGINENLIMIWDITTGGYGAIDLSGNIVIDPIYNYLYDLGYNGWIGCSLEYNKNGIFDSYGNIVYDTKYNNIYYSDCIVMCLQDENGNSIMIDKETGLETYLNGDIGWLEANEILYNGVLMNSKGEPLTEKTELIRNKFGELAGEGVEYKSVFNGSSFYYLDDNAYLITIGSYNEGEQNYTVNYKGEIIASDYEDISNYAPGLYKITKDTDYGRTYSIIDFDGNTVFPETEEYPNKYSDSVVYSENYSDDSCETTLYNIDGSIIGYYVQAEFNGDYMLLKESNGNIGFAKTVDLPDIDISDKIILFVGEKDTYVYGEYRANDVKPLIRNGRTMVPIRAVAEALDAEVSWNGDMQMVSITRDEIAINIVIGDSYATVNGEAVAIDSPAFIENGRTYLPVRFVSEALGAKVDWDEKTQAVILSVAEPEEEPEYSEGSVVNGNLILNNFQYWYEEDPYMMEANEGSVGSMALSGVVTGPENVSDVLIAAWGEEPFSAEEIESIIAEMTDIWKEEFGVMDFDVPFEFITTHPVEEVDMGKKMYVLLVGVDAEGNAVGYAVVEEVVNK